MQTVLYTLALGCKLLKMFSWHTGQPVQHDAVLLCTTACSAKLCDATATVCNTVPCTAALCNVLQRNEMMTMF